MTHTTKQREVSAFYITGHDKVAGFIKQLLCL